MHHIPVVLALNQSLHSDPPPPNALGCRISVGICVVEAPSSELRHKLDVKSCAPTWCEVGTRVRAQVGPKSSTVEDPTIYISCRLTSSSAAASSVFCKYRYTGKDYWDHRVVQKWCRYGGGETLTSKVIFSARDRIPLVFHPFSPNLILYSATHDRRSTLSHSQTELGPNWAQANAFRSSTFFKIWSPYTMI